MPESEEDIRCAAMISPIKSTSRSERRWRQRQRDPFRGIHEDHLPRRNLAKSASELAKSNNNKKDKAEAVRTFSFEHFEDLQIMSDRAWTTKSERIERTLPPTDPGLPAHDKKNSDTTNQAQLRLDEWKLRRKQQLLKQGNSNQHKLLQHFKHAIESPKTRPKSASANSSDWDERQRQMQAEQTAKRKMLRSGDVTGTLINFGRRRSKVAAAHASLHHWREKKLTIRNHLHTLTSSDAHKVGEPIPKIECMTEISLDQIKDDLHTHTVKYQGKLETFVRKRLRERKEAAKFVQASNAVIECWKRQKRWVTLVTIVKHLEIFKKYGKSHWNRRYKVFHSVIKTEWHIRLFVKGLKRRVAAHKCRLFLKAAIPRGRGHDFLFYECRYAFLKFRRSCVFLQRIVRDFLACHHARIESIFRLKKRAIEDAKRRRSALIADITGLEVIKKWKDARKQVNILLKAVSDPREEKAEQAKKEEIDQIGKVGVAEYVSYARKRHIGNVLPEYNAALKVWKNGIRKLGPDDVKLLLADTSKETLRKHTSLIHTRSKPQFPPFASHRSALEDPMFHLLELNVPEQ